MDEYLARLCWNSKGWTAPTGEAAQIERGSYASRNRFGHEEWLFDPEAILDGWQYGFLQPVSLSRDRLAGESIDVRLYTIAAAGRRYYVGRLPECEVLTLETAEAARQQFTRQGRLARMGSQLKSIGGVVAGIHQDDPRWLVNVRFRPDSAERHDPPVPVNSGDMIRNFNRYVLVRLDGERSRVIEEWPSSNRVPALRPPTIYPDEVPEDSRYAEGAARTVTINAYERDPRARAACLAHYGPTCCVCGISPEKVFGAGFSGVIHVHHLEPLSSGKVRSVHPVRDLRPVCPTCHAALHKRNPPYTPNELKQLMGK